MRISGWSSDVCSSDLTGSDQGTGSCAAKYGARGSFAHLVALVLVTQRAGAERRDRPLRGGEIIGLGFRWLVVARAEQQQQKAKHRRAGLSAPGEHQSTSSTSTCSQIGRAHV